jgi:hypothetical protein
LVILRPIIFNECPEIVFGFCTKIDNNTNHPYYFNLSLSVKDNKEKVEQNRSKFFDKVGLSYNDVAIQKQIHTDIVRYVDEPGFQGESDAMFTDKNNIGLAITTADCPAIFVFEKIKKIIAAVHSGWRSTEREILHKTLVTLQKEYNCKPEDLIAYIAPSVSQSNYEVGKEVAEKFGNKYLKSNGEKFLLDIAKINYDILIKFGVKQNNVQASSLCTYASKNILHSFRRDGLYSGRSMGVIAMRRTTG